MLAPSFSLSFTKVTDNTASSLNPSSSSSSSSIEHLHLSSIHVPIKATKPTFSSKLTPHLCFVKSAPFSLLSRSLFVCASAAFDGFEETEALEEETATPDEEQQQEVAEENGVASASELTEGRRLYVGNLPYSMTSSQLADVFSECDRVVSVEIVYDRVTDRSRGFAFVTTGSFEEAKEAIRLFDGSQIGCRTAKVNFPEVPRGGEREVMDPKIRSSYQGFVDSPHKIYAGNLHWGLTSQYLREAFQDQPGYLSARVVYDRDTRKSRGFGFVSFDSAEHVNSAISAMNGVELEGRPLRLNLAQQRFYQSSPQELKQNLSQRAEAVE